MQTRIIVLYAEIVSAKLTMSKDKKILRMDVVCFDWNREENGVLYSNVFFRYDVFVLFVFNRDGACV